MHTSNENKFSCRAIENDCTEAFCIADFIFEVLAKEHILRYLNVKDKNSVLSAADFVYTYKLKFVEFFKLSLIKLKAKEYNSINIIIFKLNCMI